MITRSLLTGINIRDDKDINYALLICNGTKTIETRDTNSLKPWINKRVRIIRTGIKKAQIIGEVTIEEPIIYNNEIEFIKDIDKHLVKPNSKFWIKENKIKFGYPIIDSELYIKSYDAVGTGIIARCNQPYFIKLGE